MKFYADLPLREYLTDAASGEPTPGGGSVAAVVGALATTMATMGANFTLGRPKFAQHDQQVQAEMDRLEAQRTAYLELMQEDMAAYGRVLAAYRLPKSSDEEKQVRRQAIQQALREAMAVPLQSAAAALSTLQSSAVLAGMVNPNLLSDVAVAAVLAEAVFECGQINVEINLSQIKDESLVQQTRQRLAEISAESRRLKALCLQTIADRQKP